jgi:hypothetical protein
MDHRLFDVQHSRTDTAVEVEYRSIYVIAFDGVTRGLRVQYIRKWLMIFLVLTFCNNSEPHISLQSITLHLAEVKSMQTIAVLTWNSFYKPLVIVYWWIMFF